MPMSHGSGARNGVADEGTACILAYSVKSYI